MPRPGHDRPVVVAVERAVVEPLRLEEHDRVVVLDRAISSPLASYGLDGITVLRPQTWVNIASALWLWVWPPKMPPPHGMRTVIGAVNSPPER